MTPTEERPQGRKRHLDWLIFGLCAGVFFSLVFLFPNQGTVSARAAWQYLVEMVQIMPAVLVLMGLFSVWISKEVVVRYLGQGSGIGGIVVAILFGTLPTGPLYVAFPVARALLDKGASVRNVVAFLSAWACIKIPQELVEIKFLGAEFTALRLGLTVVFVALMGWTIEKVLERTERRTENDRKGKRA
jgi:uncharacterized membrane protein YraQ (UPF0718 family)